MNDFGDDIRHHHDVRPLFGSLRALDPLVAALRHCGLRLLIGAAPRSSSDQHPWGHDGRVSRTPSERGGYIWWAPPPGGSPREGTCRPLNPADATFAAPGALPGAEGLRSTHPAREAVAPAHFTLQPGTRAAVVLHGG